MLQLFGFLSNETGSSLLNLITCAEMVMFAAAQSIAFTYTSHLDSGFKPRLSDNPHHLSNTRKTTTPGFCEGLFSLLTSTTDVIDDTRNTFIKSYDEEEGDKETQLDELMKCRDAFNWSDEELLEERDKQRKGKHNKNNLPKVKGGRNQSITSQAFESIKR
jgi:hypothetical protein